jgi:hypothetical protein
MKGKYGKENRWRRMCKIKGNRGKGMKREIIGGEITEKLKGNSLSISRTALISIAVLYRV